MLSVFTHKSGLEVAMGDNCLIETLTSLKALKSQLTYLRILPQNTTTQYYFLFIFSSCVNLNLGHFIK